jgi:replicative DNA helicase
MTDNRLPPHNIDAERAVLGGILIDEDAMFEVDFLHPAHFYGADHRKTFEAMRRLYDTGQPIDVLTVANEMGGDVDANMVRNIDLTIVVPTSSNTRAYAVEVRDQARRRRMIQLAGKMASAAWDDGAEVDDTLAELETAVLDIRQATTVRDVQKPQAYTSEFIDRFTRAVDQGSEGLRGIRSGYIDVDNIIGGFEAPHQYVLAARPKMGKSAFLLNVIHDAVFKQGKRVLLFSLEMSAHQVMQRMVSLMTRIPVAVPAGGCLRRPWLLTEEETRRVYDATGRISEARLYIDDTAGITPSAVRSRAMRIRAQHGLDMICVDHLHIMGSDEKYSRESVMYSEITKRLAALYKELNVPGITVAQLNRSLEQRQNKRPLLSDLRESGGIEENAYAAMFLYRPAYYDEMESETMAELIVAANRDGATGTAGLYWDGKTMTFKNLARETIQL